MWDEWPERDGSDTGIDLIGEERDGGLCAIQCKFFDPYRWGAFTLARQDA